MRRTIWGIVILLLVIAPTLDLAWNEPAVGWSLGAHCQVHATPGMTFEPVRLIVAFTSEPLLSDNPSDYLLGISSAIDIPPRL